MTDSPTTDRASRVEETSICRMMICEGDAIYEEDVENLGVAGRMECPGCNGSLEGSSEEIRVIYGEEINICVECKGAGTVLVSL